MTWLARYLGICVLFLGVASLGSGAEIRGVAFADSVQTEHGQLELKGLAVLKWARLFEVYAGALYLPPGHSGPAWIEDVPKRLELAYFREIAAQGFADASISLLQKTLPPATYLAIEDRLRDFCALFQDVRPGDRYSITYFPGRGTELSLNHQPLGRVAGADFALAYFGIWLGDNPINPGFRDRLLKPRPS